MNAMCRMVSAAAVALTALVPAAAAAQTPPRFPADSAGFSEVRADRSTIGDLRLSLDRIVRESGAVADRQTQAPTHQSSSAPRERSLTRKIVGGALGALGGFFGGLYLGAAIEGDSCNCDDPGLKGALIGAPIGAVVGGIVGAKWF